LVPSVPEDRTTHICGSGSATITTAHWVMRGPRFGRLRDLMVLAPMLLNDDCFRVGVISYRQTFQFSRRWGCAFTLLVLAATLKTWPMD